MKVTCQSCQAKYTIADEKVRGKVAKIRCKKCGTTIIVNGTDSTSASAVADQAQSSGADDQWSVLVADGDQRTMTTPQVVELYAGGTISQETPVWKDGMADWLPISQVEALRSAIEVGTVASDPSLMNASLLPNASMLPDVAAPAPMLIAEPVAAKAPAPAARINAPEPAARRRPRGGSTDLFGAAVQDDVMTSAAVDPVPHAGADKPTGARNENSVLFSLASLTGGGGPAPAKPSPSADKGPPSSKADLRSLMTGNAPPAPPQKSKLDDIINLSGGGVYSPTMLTAPILAPPPPDLSAAADAVGVAPKAKGKGLLFAIIGGIVIVGSAAAFTMNGKAESDKALAAASASAKAAQDALAAALAAAEAPAPAAPAEPSSAAEAPAQAPTVLAPGQAPPKAETEKKAVPAAVRSEKPEKEKPSGPSGPPGAAALGIPPPAAPAPAAPAPAAGGSGEFDRAAALSVLSAAATAAQSCKKSDGPTGTGRIAVTFANNGQATTATVDGPPFAGTPVGGCIAARFRGVHVPPFGGGTVTVKKTFFIN